MKEFLDLLPDIIQYLSVGYIFIIIYQFVAVRKKESDFKGILLMSLCIGFVLESILLQVFGDKTVNIIMLLSAGVILGLVLGLIRKSDFFAKILESVKIDRTVNEQIWYDIKDKNYNTKIIVVSLEKSLFIEGILNGIEENNRIPMLLLQQYKTGNVKTGRLYNDYKDKGKEQILIDTSKFDYIKITYDIRSKKCVTVDDTKFDDK